MEEKLSVRKMSFIPASLLLIAGFILLFIYGLKPYESWYNKNYRWIEIDGFYQRGSIITVSGPKSMVAKSTGARFKVKFVLRYEPRKLYDTAYFDQEFPPWLRLPAQSFLWTKTDKTYESAVEANKALAEIRKTGKFTLYMDPANPRKARLYIWDKWLMPKIGAILAALALLGFGFIFIVNTRRVMIAQRQHQEELWRQKNARRHHNKGPRPPAPEQ